MPSYAHPGVYIEEIPSGVRPIEAVGTSTAAFIGYATKGPVSEPVRLTRWDGYDNRFGGLHSGDDALGQSVNAYFMNGGSVAYVVRLARDSVASTGRLLHPDADPDAIAAGDTLFTFEAESGGSWGDGYRVVVTAKPGGTLYRVAVQSAETLGAQVRWRDVEVFDNVSFDPTSPAYVVPVLGDGSPLLQVTAADAQASMVGESASQDLSAVDDLSGLNGRSLTVTVNGTARQVQFPATGDDAFDADTTLADVAGVIQGQVRGQVTANDAVAGFTASSEAGRLVLRSGAPGPSSRVAVTGAGDAGDATEVLLLGAARDGAERTGDEVLHDLLSATVGTSGSHIVNLSGGADGTAPLPGDYAEVFEKFLKIRDINTICLPGCTYGPGSATKPVIDQAIAHAEQTMSRMVLVDPPGDTALVTEQDVDGLGLPTSSYAALYYPWLHVPNPSYHPESAPDEPRTISVPPSGFAAGMWGRTDTRRGVWKAPAGTETSLLGVAGLADQVEDLEQDVLNPSGVNCIRALPGYGTVIWGSRTLATRAQPEWRYVPVRRTAIFIERSIHDGMQWAVFEPNSHLLWASLRANIGSFMDGLFRAGAFQGEKPSDAYFVRCNLGDTMTQDDVDRGQVIVVVGFAPLKPAEFVIVRIQQKVNQR